VHNAGMRTREMKPRRECERHPRSTGLSNQSGITYAETMTMIAVFALLGLIAKPVFSEIKSTYKLHGASRQVFAEMQKARMAAIMENTRCRARMQSGNLVFERYDVGSAQWQSMVGQELNPDDITGMSLSMSDITFAPNGSAPASGSLTIANSAGKRRTITVSPAGSIRVN
jgi:Tfp pilus assembly protein FimT